MRHDVTTACATPNIIGENFHIQARVIKALFLREIITRFGRHNLGFLWLFLEPMLICIAITVVWTYLNRSYGLIPIAGFALTGYSVILAWRTTVNRTMTSISPNVELLYHRQVTVFDIAFTRALLEIISVSVSFIVLSLVFTSMNLMSLPVDPLKVVGAWILLGWFLIAAGFIALYLDHISDLFERIWQIAIFVTLPFTGAFTMLSWLPQSAQTILLYSPMVNAVEMLREGYFGRSIQAKYSISYLLICNITLTAVALLLISKVKKMLSKD